MENEGRRSIVYFGTPKISAPALQALVDAGFHIPLVVTRPDRSSGRNRRELLPPPVKLRALELGLPVMQPESVKDGDFLDRLEEIGASAFCVFAFGRILPERLINTPPLGMYNAHASLLPALRGAAPINRAILDGHENTGVTIQRVAFELDSGPVCWRRELAIDPRETAITLGEKLLPLAKEGLVQVLSKVFEGANKESPQDQSLATWAPPLKKTDGYVDWSRSSVEIDRLVRGLVPWPGTFARIGGEKIRLHEVEPLGDQSGLQPGTVVSAGKDGILVACGEGTLKINELQAEGRKRVSAQAYLCGHGLKGGDRFYSPDD